MRYITISKFYFYDGSNFYVYFWCLYVFGIFFDVKRKAFLFRIVDQFIYIISIFIIVICYMCRIIFYKKENKWGICSKLDLHETWTNIYEHFWMSAYRFAHS